jgi:TolB-like protein/tetratricopeptide (TPR) repeat protein
MGVVYEAEDLRLHRHVALKFLPESLTRDAASLSRFEREARMASSLNHPHICTVYDIGTLGTAPYIVMELLQGETLRNRIATGPLSLEEFLQSAPQIVSAVAAAHTRRIVHRDLKPANIFVTRDGIIKVLDFGLAKPLGATDDEATMIVTAPGGGDQSDMPPELVTIPGTVLGTAAYMSPEQISGRTADARSDVFALGVIFYEALTGSRPFTGVDTHEIREQIVHRTPPPPSAVAAAIPADVDHLVMKCLDKRVEQRFATAVELQKAFADLEQARRAEQSKLSAAASPRGWRTQRIEHAAVLPFETRGTDPEWAYLGDAIAEDLIRDLSAVPGLRVKARSVVQRYRGQPAAPAAVGKELGIDAVVVGSVARQGDRLSVSVEFVRCEDESLLWGDRITRGADDLVALEKQVLAQIVQEISNRLGGEPPAVRAQAHEPQGGAHDLYLRGRACWNERTPTSLERAIRYFSMAVEADPEYALAFSGLADAYTAMAFYDLVPAADVMPRAKAAALRAVERDPALPEGQASLGLVSSIYDFEWDEAGRRLRKALDLNPSLAHAHHWYAMQLSTLGSADEAYAEIKRALLLDPLATAAQGDALNILIRARRYEEAVREARRVLAVEPRWAAGWAALGRALQYDHRPTSALDAFERAVAISPANVRFRALLASAYGLTGRAGEARQMRDSLLAERTGHYVPSFWLAVIAYGLGEMEETLTRLTEAVDERYAQVAYLAVEPAFDDLRSSPGFLELLDRVHIRDVTVTGRGPLAG